LRNVVFFLDVIGLCTFTGAGSAKQNQLHRTSTEITKICA